MTKQMNLPEIKMQVARLLSEQLGIAKVSPEDYGLEIVRDFGADSLDCFELLMQIEDYFEVELLDGDYFKCQSISDIANLLEETIEDEYR